jgi:hypothetical protein
MGFGASSALSQSRPARSPKCPSTFHGVSSPIATSSSAGSIREVPCSRHFALHPQGFSPSRRLLPARTLVTLFHATTTSGVLPPGVFPREQPRSPFSSRVPSCRFSKFAYQPESWRRRPSTRLQGFDPPVESVSSGTDVTPHQASIPSWDFIPLRVFLPPALETATRLLLPWASSRAPSS